MADLAQRERDYETFWIIGHASCLSAAIDGIGDYALFSCPVSCCFWALSALCVSEERRGAAG